MKNNTLLFPLALLVLTAVVALRPIRLVAQGTQQQPNVIFICPDQYRNYSVGFWSKGDNDKYIQGEADPVNTPSIDKIAESGIVLSRAISNFPLCSPYRGMLMSGMYPTNNGITNNCRKDRDAQLKTETKCITNVFADAGYNVAYFGKTHWLKNDPVFDEKGTYKGTTTAPGGSFINRYDTYIPPGKDRHGIDYFFQCIKDDHFNPMVYSNDPKAIDGKKDGELYMPKKFSAELEADNIKNYLSNTHEQRSEEKPFFMIWSLNPPHNPWTKESTKMEFYDQYTEKGKVNLDKLLTHENADHEVGHYAPYYFANVSAVDYYIGQVMDHLEKLGLMENTIVVFSSDHGEMLGSHGKRGKNYPEVESFNIPFIIKWGNNLEHRVDDLMLSVPDVMPTILGLAGLEKATPKTVQGRNFSNVLLGDKQAKKPQSALFMNSNARGVYTGKYTYVVDNHKKVTVFYYDNEKDPNQLTKKAATSLDKKTKEMLETELASLLKQTGDQWYLDRTCKDVIPYE